MSKSKFSVEKKQDVVGDVHPIWSGIGCVMLILIPVLAFAGSCLLVNSIGSVQAFLRKSPYMDDTVDIMGWMPGLANLIPQIAPHLIKLKTSLGIPAIPYFWGKLAISVIFAVIGFGLYGVLYAIIYRISAPSRYGPMDAPPKRYKKKRKFKKVKY